ncbi:MAG: siroheme decarboxylase subunit beta [Planctomycetota bacterium]|jgi:DNA-binding Lrp family transcriptional regulator
MKNQISDIEQKILAVIQHGLPKSQNPFKDMAEKIGIETGQLLTILKEWKQQGKIRRIGAIVNHFKVGLGGGAMVVWQVEPERTEEVGKVLADFDEVSHAYERRTNENWSYNLYTMVHGKSDEEVQQTVLRMSQVCGISNYRILITEKELKKVPPTYITQIETNSDE